MKTRICCHSLMKLAASALAVVLVLGVGTAQEKPYSTQSKVKEFFFDEPHHPERFIKAVQKHFGLEWDKVVTLPEDQFEFGPIPKLRIKTQDPMDVIKLYNRLSDQNPGLGRWVVEGNITNPSAVMLVPDRSSSTPVIKVKAFPLRGIPTEKRGHLERTALDVGLDVMLRGRASGARPSVQITERAEVLVAYGSDEFIQFVDSLLVAYRANLQIGTNGSGGGTGGGGGGGGGVGTNQPARR